MTLRRVGRQPEELGALSLFASLDEGGKTSVADAQRRVAFLDRISGGLSTSLASEARVHGWRVQAMFEAMIVGLGGVALLKAEDEGVCWTHDDVKVPDYRLVGLNGDLLLVEVKNVSPSQVLRRQRMSIAETAGLTRYAELMRARLLLAHYWSGVNLWTLVDAETTNDKGRFTTSLEEAMKANELGLFGDAMIGTTPPLMLTLAADTAKQRAMRPIDNERSHATFTVGAATISCAGRELTNATEQSIAMFLMLYGGWPGDERVLLDADGLPKAIEFVHSPIEPALAEHQGFDIVGSLSSMYSTLYNAATLDATGSITALGYTPAPDALSQLVPADYWDRNGRALPLWRITPQPASGPMAEAEES